MMKAVSLKIEDRQLKLLEGVSKQTRIPKSTLIREGITLVIRQHEEGIVDAQLQREIASLIKEDKEVLKKLAK